MSARRPIPRLSATPMYCIVVDGARWLALGLFGTKKAAKSQADGYFQPRDWFSRFEISIEPIWVSPPDMRARARKRPARPGRDEANAG